MERDLVERARSGDLEAFSELARAWIDRLYVLARLILRDSDRARDATQEALIVAWRDLSGSARPRQVRCHGSDDSSSRRAIARLAGPSVADSWRPRCGRSSRT